MPLTTRRILLVDDEPTLLNSMKAYLARQGYDVVACLSALAAWEQFEANPPAYSLAIVDITLRGISGEELIRRMAKRNPQMAVLGISGYPVSLDALRRDCDVHIEFLEKPFTPSMLSEAVKQLVSKSFGQSG